MYEDKEMSLINREIFSRNGNAKPRMAWSDVRRKRLEKKAWGKSEWMADFDREMRAVEMPYGGDYKDYATASYDAAVDWVSRNETIMPANVLAMFDSMPDGYSCPRAWLAWCHS